MQQKMADLKDAGIDLMVVVEGEDSAVEAYGVLSPATDPVVVIAPKALYPYMIAGFPSNLLIGPGGKPALGQVGWSKDMFGPWLDAAKAAKAQK